MQSSSIARENYSIGLSTKIQNKKNTTFLALLKQSFTLECTKKVFKAFLKHTFRGANLSKKNSKISKNF